MDIFDNSYYSPEEEQLQTVLYNKMDYLTEEEQLHMDFYDNMGYFTEQERLRMDLYDNTDSLPDEKQLRIFDHHGEINPRQRDLDLCQQDWGMKMRYDSNWIRAALKSIPKFDGTNMLVEEFISAVCCSVENLEPEEVDIFHYFLLEKLQGDAWQQIYPLRKHYHHIAEILNDLRSLYSAKMYPSCNKEYNRGSSPRKRQHIRYKPYGCPSRGSTKRCNTGYNAFASVNDIFCIVREILPQVEPDAETENVHSTIDTVDQLEKPTAKVTRSPTATVTKVSDCSNIIETDSLLPIDAGFEPLEVTGEVSVQAPLTAATRNSYSAVSILHRHGTARRSFDDPILDGCWSIQETEAGIARNADCQSDKSTTTPNETRKGVG